MLIHDFRISGAMSTFSSRNHFISILKLWNNFYHQPFERIWIPGDTSRPRLESLMLFKYVVDKLTNADAPIDNPDVRFAADEAADVLLCASKVGIMEVRHLYVLRRTTQFTNNRRFQIASPFLWVPARSPSPPASHKPCTDGSAGWIHPRSVAYWNPLIPKLLEGFEKLWQTAYFRYHIRPSSLSCRNSIIWKRFVRGQWSFGPSCWAIYDGQQTCRLRYSGCSWSLSFFRYQFCKPLFQKKCGFLYPLKLR